jgi:hypothetical protein
MVGLIGCGGSHGREPFDHEIEQRAQTCKTLQVAVIAEPYVAACAPRLLLA